MPIIATAFGFALIYVTSLPMPDEGQSIGGELLSFLLTLAAIMLALFIIFKVEPKVFPESAEFPLKRPDFKVIAGILLRAMLQTDGGLTIQKAGCTSSCLSCNGIVIRYASRP